MHAIFSGMILLVHADGARRESYSWAGLWALGLHGLPLFFLFGPTGDRPVPPRAPQAAREFTESYLRHLCTLGFPARSNTYRATGSLHDDPHYLNTKSEPLNTVSAENSSEMASKSKEKDEMSNPPSFAKAYDAGAGADADAEEC